MAVKRSKGKKFIEIDFEGVEAGGKVVPDDVYDVEVADVTEEESGDGNPYLKWKFKITEGDCKGSVLFDNTSLQPQALWRLKGLLECLGEDVPDSVMKMDISEYIGTEMQVTVVNESYEGKERPKVSEYGPAGGKRKSSKKASKAKEEPEDDDDDDAEEEKKPAKKKKASKADDDDEPEFKKGQRVKFTDDEDKVQKGKIVSVDDDTATVDVAGEEWEIQVSDLTAL